MELIVRERDAAGRPRAREADEVLGADVRGEDGRADDEPAEAAAREEIVFRRVLVVVEDPPRQPRKAAKYARMISQSRVAILDPSPSAGLP